jgi:hypothetical protein
VKSAELPTATVHEVPTTMIHEVPTPPAYTGNSYREAEATEEHYAELQSHPSPQQKPEDFPFIAPGEAGGIIHHQQVPSIDEREITLTTSFRRSAERENAKSGSTTPVRFYQRSSDVKNGGETSVKVVEELAP